MRPVAKFPCLLSPRRLRFACPPRRLLQLSSIARAMPLAASSTIEQTVNRRCCVGGSDTVGADSAAPASLVAASGPAPRAARKVFYSLGQAAQSGGFDTAVGFVFFYYSVVLGLPGTL